MNDQCRFTTNNLFPISAYLTGNTALFWKIFFLGNDEKRVERKYNIHMIQFNRYTVP